MITWREPEYDAVRGEWTLKADGVTTAQYNGRIYRHEARGDIPFFNPHYGRLAITLNGLLVHAYGVQRVCWLLREDALDGRWERAIGDALTRALDGGSGERRAAA